METNPNSIETLLARRKQKAAKTKQSFRKLLLRAAELCDADQLEVSEAFVVGLCEFASRARSDPRRYAEIESEGERALARMMDDDAPAKTATNGVAPREQASAPPMTPSPPKDAASTDRPVETNAQAKQQPTPATVGPASSPKHADTAPAAAPAPTEGEIASQAPRPVAALKDAPPTSPRIVDAALSGGGAPPAPS